MRFPAIEKLAGTTLKATFVNSGAVASPISSALLDWNDVVVNSVVAVSSLNGAYYALHLLPNSAGWYVNEWKATIAANSYTERQMVRVRKVETD